MTHTQNQAAKLDQWDTYTLYQATTSTQQLWAILGLTEYAPSGPEAVYFLTAPATFNRTTRIFWQHMVFDMLAHVSGYTEGEVPKVVPQPHRLCEIQKSQRLSTVST